MPESVERVTKVMTNSSLYWARPLRFEIVGWRPARCVLRNVPEFNVLPGIRNSALPVEGVHLGFVCDAINL